MMTTLHTASRVERLSFTSFDGEKPALPDAVKPLPQQVAVSAAPPVPPAPVFNMQDVQAARNEGHAQGFSEGEASAKAKINEEAAAREAAIRELLGVIANRVTIAAEAHSGYLKAQQEIMGKMVLAIARKLSGEALRREPYANVEALLRECVGFIAAEPKITIAVSSASAAGLRQRIDGLRPLLQGFEGELIVEEDAALGQQDCRVEWKNGYAEHNAEAVWSQIASIIAKTTI